MIAAKRECVVCDDRGCEFCPRVTDPLAAAKGVFNGLVAGVILWALVAAILFYGFRITL